MKVAFHIPGVLRPLAGGADVVEIEGTPATAREALEQLFSRWPGLRHRILDEQGALRPHVNVFVGEESIRFTGGLDAPMGSAREVFLIPAVSGGAPRRIAAENEGSGSSWGPRRSPRARSRGVDPGAAIVHDAKCRR